MKVSVIIRCRNEERFIGHCIQSIFDYFDNNSEIIIVDNNSTDNSKDIIKLFSNNKVNKIKIKYLTINDYTPGKSLNLGIKHCTQDIVLVISAHCILTKINYQKIETLLENNIAVWGKQIPIYFGKKINRNRYIWKNFEEKDSVNYFSEGEDRYFLHNALCFYKKKDLIKYPFDETFIGKEDRYWAIDRINEGLNIYYDSNLICHHNFTLKGATWKTI